MGSENPLRRAAVAKSGNSAAKAFLNINTEAIAPIFAAMAGLMRGIPYQNGTASHLPALNPHLTKSRLNAGLCLCEIVRWNSADDRAVAAVRRAWGVHEIERRP